MAKIFLDTNYFIDAIHRNPEADILSSLEENIAYISPISIHIYCYIFKIHILDTRLLEQKEKFQLVDVSEEVVDKSLRGPTSDFEDNVQLHSAAMAECELFLTNDNELLKMKFFGKTRIDNFISIPQ